MGANRLKAARVMISSGDLAQHEEAFCGEGQACGASSNGFPIILTWISGELMRGSCSVCVCNGAFGEGSLCCQCSKQQCHPIMQWL